MITARHYISKTNADKPAVWIITGLLFIIFFPYIKAFVVYMLLKLYELFIQHGME